MYEFSLVLNYVIISVKVTNCRYVAVLLKITQYFDERKTFCFHLFTIYAHPFDMRIDEFHFKYVLMKTAILRAPVCDQYPFCRPQSKTFPISGLTIAFTRYGVQTITAFCEIDRE